MDAAIIEFDALADAVGPAAQDHHLLAVGRLGFALGRGEAVALVAAVHVRRARGEFGGAGVDALEDRGHLQLFAQGPDIAGVLAGQHAEELVAKAHLLQTQQLGRGLGQAVLAQPGLGLDQLLDLLQEPAVIGTAGMDLVDGEPVAERLGDHQQAIGARLRQHRLDGILVLPAIGAGDIDRVESGQAGFHRAQALLQALLESAADAHRLAHRLHRGGQALIGAGELLEGEARDLGDDIIDGRLERGRGDAGNVVVELVQRVADRQLGGDLGDGEAGRLRRQGRRARHARIHLDHHHAPIGRIDGELHVRAAGIDADLAQHRDRGVAHDLIFLVGQGQRRGHGDAVTGMDAHRVDILDRADDDAVVRLVADDLHLISFQPSTDSSTRTSCTGLAARPPETICSNSSAL